MVYLFKFFLFILFILNLKFSYISWLLVVQFFIFIVSIFIVILISQLVWHIVCNKLPKVIQNYLSFNILVSCFLVCFFVFVYFYFSFYSYFCSLVYSWLVKQWLAMELFFNEFQKFQLMLIEDSKLKQILLDNMVKHNIGWLHSIGILLWMCIFYKIFSVFLVSTLSWVLVLRSLRDENIILKMLNPVYITEYTVEFRYLMLFMSACCLIVPSFLYFKFFFCFCCLVIIGVIGVFFQVFFSWGYPCLYYWFVIYKGYNLYWNRIFGQNFLYVKLVYFLKVIAQRWILRNELSKSIARIIHNESFNFREFDEDF